MSLRRPALLPLFGLAAMLVGVTEATHPFRYVARLQDGQVLQGNALRDWHAPLAAPQLDDRPLLDAANPFIWLLDRSSAPPAVPESYLELITGDRLPGIVESYRTGSASGYQLLPPHFVVRCWGTNLANLEPKPDRVRVNARYVRRIVWRRPHVESSSPQTALLDNGSAWRFRSIRWGDSEATLLTDGGVKRVAYAELAELHLAVEDYWGLYLDEVSQLTPEGQSRLLQLETTDGLVATASFERFLPRAVGDARDANRWLHGLQPAWSLDMLWVPHRQIWMRRSWSPQDVPLFRLPPARSEQRSPLGPATFPAQINRNVMGGPLRWADGEAGWGVGVHAHSELEYELPAFARAFRTGFAIDASMNGGGCVLARVLDASADRNPLFEGPVLVGSARVIETGRIRLAGGQAPRRLVLQVDPVLDDRPRGADPFDIRDHANWLDPIVELDREVVQKQLAARASGLAPAWRGWQWELEPGGRWQWDNYFAAAPGNRGEFHHVVSLRGKPLKLTRRRLASTERWLLLDALRSEPSGVAPRVRVRIGEAAPTEHELPAYDAQRIDYRPIVLPLVNERGRDVEPALIEVLQLPASDGVSVWWRSMAVSAEHPLLHCIFEDELPRGVRPEGASSRIEQDRTIAYSGSASGKFSPGGPVRLAFARPVAIRERPQIGDFRFLRMVLRKQGGGGLRVTLEQPDRSRVAIYEGGGDAPADRQVRRFATKEFGSEWLVVTRDLYSDFGELDLSGVTMECLGGVAAWFDHVYLARTQNDFELTELLLRAAAR